MQPCIALHTVHSTIQWKVFILPAGSCGKPTDTSPWSPTLCFPVSPLCSGQMNSRSRSRVSGCSAAFTLDTSALPASVVVSRLTREFAPSRSCINSPASARDLTDPARDIVGLVRRLCRTLLQRRWLMRRRAAFRAVGRQFGNYYFINTTRNHY